MKCVNCEENKWVIKDFKSENKYLKMYIHQLENLVEDYKAREYSKKCGYCPRDMIGHYEDCEAKVLKSVY